MIFKKIRENLTCDKCGRVYVKDLLIAEDVITIKFTGYCDCVEKEVLECVE